MGRITMGANMGPGMEPVRNLTMMAPVTTKLHTPAAHMVLSRARAIAMAFIIFCWRSMFSCIICRGECNMCALKQSPIVVPAFDDPSSRRKKRPSLKLEGVFLRRGRERVINKHVESLGRWIVRSLDIVELVRYRK